MLSKLAAMLLINQHAANATQLDAQQRSNAAQCLHL
jgi:hypothetical protein